MRHHEDSRVPGNRKEFCELLIEMCNTNHHFPCNMTFTDEAIFWTNGEASSQNNHCWSNGNPYQVIDTHSQHPKKLNMFVGFIGSKIIKTFFINENINTY